MAGKGDQQCEHDREFEAMRRNDWKTLRGCLVIAIIMALGIYAGCQAWVK